MAGLSLGENVMDPIGSLLHEDRQLRIGSAVRVYWSAYGYSFEACGRIERLTRKHAEVTLSLPVPASREHPPIRRVSVPRIGDPVNWSSSHCLRLVQC